MKSRTTREFRDLLDKLPQEVRQQAKIAYGHFRRDPNHRGLRFKIVDSENRVFSVRIGSHYRALGYREGDQIVWFWIGTHAEYDRLLSQR